MNSLATKLAFSALVVATLATPAFAQRLSRQQPQDYYTTARSSITRTAPRAPAPPSPTSPAPMFNQGY